MIDNQLHEIAVKMSVFAEGLEPNCCFSLVSKLASYLRRCRRRLLNYKDLSKASMIPNKHLLQIVHDTVKDLKYKCEVHFQFHHDFFLDLGRVLRHLSLIELIKNLGNFVH